MHYIQGEARNQDSLFPVSLDESVPDDHLVRVIEAYVARLNLREMGFSKPQPKQTGRPSYDPADPFKLYRYGYFQGIRSSRRLEAECQRNAPRPSDATSLGIRTRMPLRAWSID